jgi:hypothetical protein
MASYADPRSSPRPTRRALHPGAGPQLPRAPARRWYVPQPDPDNQTVYVVVMPTGAISADSGFDGEHNYYTHHGRRIHYAWTAKSGSLDSATRILSHEVVEAATDPEGTGFLGIPGACDQDAWCEIADACPGTAVVDGITVWPYWSNQTGGCVASAVPTAGSPGHQPGIGGRPAAADSSLRPPALIGVAHRRPGASSKPLPCALRRCMRSAVVAVIWRWPRPPRCAARWPIFWGSTVWAGVAATDGIGAGDDRPGARYSACRLPAGAPYWRGRHGVGVSGYRGRRWTAGWR